MSAERLYSPALLALTVELANWPVIENAHVHAETRSPTCGSTLALDLVLDDHRRIDSLGLRVRACAVGQAAAAVFARHATNRDLASIQAAHDRIEGWLEGEAPIADWPGIEIIAAAREYPGRHGAIMLPWKAALAALSSTAAAS